jgi:hypothetical protein
MSEAAHQDLDARAGAREDAAGRKRWRESLKASEEACSRSRRGRMKSRYRVCSAVMAFGMFALAGCDKAPEKKEIVECRISVEISFTEFLELRITDRQLIKELVEDPLKKALPDPSPKKYEIRGSVIFKRKGGTKDGIALFHPWGRYKVGDRYMIADFSGIQKALKKAIAAADLTLASRTNTAGPLDKAQAPEKKKIVECWISLDLGSSTGFLELRIVDPDLIKRLIEDPLRKARPDPHPAKDKVLGSMIFRRKAGAEDRITLYEPWGRYAEEKKYMIADFSGIQKRFKKAVDHVKEFELLK